MAQEEKETGTRVKKHCRAPGKMRLKVTYEYAEGPELDRAIGVLAQMMEDSARRLSTEKRKSMELNEGLNRTSSRVSDIDMSSYGVYTTKGGAS